MAWLIFCYVLGALVVTALANVLHEESGASSKLNIFSQAAVAYPSRGWRNIQRIHGGSSTMPNRLHPDVEYLALSPGSHRHTLHTDTPRLGKIVGGSSASASEYPYVLQLNKGRSHACGAAIIGRKWAVTAAHCVFQKGKKMPLRKITLRAGAISRNKGGRLHYVNKMVVPQSYDPKTFDYDIVLMQVVEPFVFGPDVQPVALPTQGQSVVDGDIAVISGWGRTRADGDLSETLLHVAIPVVNLEKCQAAYRNVSRKVTSRMICAGANERDSCQGDSGGPLVRHGLLIGVISFGYGCARSMYPGVYTRIPDFRDFIRNNTRI